jgi:hypothetical protein
VTPRALALSLLLLAGCPSPPASEGLNPANNPDSLLDYNQFVCTVMPVLIRRCSYLGCHGNPLHAFRVYSPGKLRLADDGTRNSRDGALTASEVELNFQSASGLVLTATPQERAAPDLQKVLLLGKPLKRSAGGGEHHGVGIFPVYPAKSTAEDLEFSALVQWVQGLAQPRPVDSACADVFNNLNLMPR